MPNLTAEEVERYVALGRDGLDRLSSGDPVGAEAAFQGQIAIFPPNPEPYVSLAFLEAGRGDKKVQWRQLTRGVWR